MSAGTLDLRRRCRARPPAGGPRLSRARTHQKNRRLDRK